MHYEADAGMDRAVWHLVGSAAMANTSEEVLGLVEDLFGRLNPVGVANFDRSLFGLVEQQLESAWRRGWQPADLGPVVRKRGSARALRVLEDVVVHEARNYAAATLHPRWTDQLASLSTSVWWDERAAYFAQLADAKDWHVIEALAAGLQTLVVLRSLPDLPMLLPPPGGAHGNSASVSSDRVTSAAPAPVLARVRALLAKAESTTFPAEAEALTAKAQQLMARHAIDRAMLAADGTEGRGNGPAGRRVSIEDPYVRAKAVLAAVVAEANDCRAVYSESFNFVTIFGHEADVDGVELLFTSLLVQATAAMAAASTSCGGSRARTASFRRSFMAGYAQRIGERLQDASAEAKAQAVTEHGERLLPVLADRSQAVEDAVAEVFPSLGKFSMSVSNGSGWASGQAAGDRANLNVRQEVPAQAS